MSDLTLYHLPGSRSGIVYWLLKELDVKFECILKQRGELLSPEYLKFSPLGKVPSIHDSNGTMIESGAIVQYILMQYGKGRLQPPSSDMPAQQKFLQWCWFAEANLGAYYTLLNLHCKFLPEDKRVPQIVPMYREKAADSLQVLEDGLKQQKTDYIMGADFTAADIMLAQGLKNAAWHDMLGAYPTLSAYAKRLMSRPGYREAYNV